MWTTSGGGIMNKNEQMVELAKGLQNSNVPEVAALANDYLNLNAAYTDLRQSIVKRIEKMDLLLQIMRNK